MASLTDILTNESKKNEVVQDALALLDEEVARKKGVSGMAIKTGYKTVKGVKPGFLRGAVEDLLPEFAEALDPLYQESVQKNVQVDQYLSDNSGRVADALLAITDGKAERAKTAVVKSAYKRLRGYARKNVEEAAPGIGRMIEKHVTAAGA